MGKPTGRNARGRMSQLGNERVSNQRAIAKRIRGCCARHSSRVAPPLVQIDDIISYHDVVRAEIWGAVAAATWGSLALSGAEGAPRRNERTLNIRLISLAS